VAVEQFARDGFLREIKTTRALEHPNVVAFRDSGCSGATFFFAAEYCDGGSVDRLMAESGGTLAVEEAVEIVSQVLDGLAYAHSAEIPGAPLTDGSLGVSRGLVHRDIKPQNILLSGTGSTRVPKLADFGLSKAFDQAGLSGHTRTGALGGTVVFMARQQIINYKFAKPEVDVWAVAATLYNMLTGALPRDFPAGADPIMVILRERAVPIRERDRSIPQRLAAVIDEALIDNPQIAVQTADELKGALQDAL
jgi:serine/threonine protein kinase